MKRYIMWLVAALVFVGCAGDSSSDPVDDVAAPVIELPANSPLEESLGIASDPGRRQYQLISQQRNADAQVVQCMKDAGFFYNVEMVDETLRSGAYVGDGSRDWTAVHGLGITSSFLELVDRPAEPATDAAAENLGYVTSLTAEEAARYDLALIGAAAPDASTAAYTPAGCWGAAFNGILQQLSYLSAFDSELASLNSRLISDPRVIAFDSTWSLCMDEAGYRYSNQQALADDIYARLLDVELDEVGRLGESAEQVLNELLIYEQASALASFDCRLGFTAELNQLRYDYEREFLDDNRFRIGEMQAAP